MFRSSHLPHIDYGHRAHTPLVLLTFDLSGCLTNLVWTLSWQPLFPSTSLDQTDFPEMSSGRRFWTKEKRSRWTDCSVSTALLLHGRAILASAGPAAMPAQRPLTLLCTLVPLVLFLGEVRSRCRPCEDRHLPWSSHIVEGVLPFRKQFV